MKKIIQYIYGVTREDPKKIKLTKDTLFLLDEKKDKIVIASTQEIVKEVCDDNKALGRDEILVLDYFTLRDTLLVNGKEKEVNTYKDLVIYTHDIYNKCDGDISEAETVIRKLKEKGHYIKQIVNTLGDDNFSTDIFEKLKERIPRS